MEASLSFLLPMDILVFTEAINILKTLIKGYLLGKVIFSLTFVISRKVCLFEYPHSGI